MINKRLGVIFALVLLLLVLMVAWVTTVFFKSDKLTIAFLNVGQGDATFIRTTGGATALIDGGADKSVLSQLSPLMPWWERKIDVLILTHNHDDHLQGLIEVIKRYQVGRLLLSHQSAILPKEIWQTIEAYHVNTELISAGQVISLGSTRLELLWPRSELPQDANDDSVVIKMTYGIKKFWLAADTGLATENELIRQQKVEQVDVLKLGHHGSDTSSGQDFLNRLKPQWTIISVGLNNKLSLPNQRIIRRLERIKTNILRTDRDGTIIFETNGYDISYRLKK